MSLHVVRQLLVMLLFVLMMEPGIARKNEKEEEELPPGFDVVTMRTIDADNRDVSFYIRPPHGFSPEPDKVHRVLLIMPFVPETGLKAIARNRQMVRLADERGWFVVSPSFAWDRERTRDRRSCFYYPERWSGKATVDALEAIAEKYPIDPNRILIQGLSGGAQYAHRFALWAPERVDAVAVNSSGWFDEPNPGAKKVCWIVTVGEADPIVPDSREFVRQLSELGVTPFFKTFMGMIHEDYPPANELCALFLAHVDDMTRDNLGKPKEAGPGVDYNRADNHPFVGDRRDELYFENTDERVGEIPIEYRVFLPSGDFAELWGDEGE